jgi:DNA-binding GntR family transcriptional regulator
MGKLKNKVYRDLRYRIITNDLQPGKLLNEKELMSQYQIGRSPLRDVLLDLQKDGLIQRIPRSGTFVSNLDFHHFREVIEVRKNLEGFATQLVGERINEKELDALRKIIQRVNQLESEKNGNLQELTQCEFEFHDILYEATHNKKLRDILYELHGISARFWHYLVFGRQELFDQFDDLKETLNALENRDCEKARQCMENHIQNFLNKVRHKIV